MLVFDLEQEQQFSLQKHVEKVLGQVGEGDVTGVSGFLCVRRSSVAPTIGRATVSDGWY